MPGSFGECADSSPVFMFRQLRDILARSHSNGKEAPRMATTFIKPYKTTKGMTAVQTMQDRFAYGLNPKKCAAVSAYLCDPKTAHLEFALIKSEYAVITGRPADKGHLFFQIRQAFLPGEVSIEEAQRIGYETAMRWTKGKYQFFVCTHNDTGNLHNHIYYNSTAEDSTRKFHNFLGSTFHVRRLSDRICLEHDLSVIRNPKQHSESKFKHYGEWLGDGKPPTFQERLRAAIDNALHDIENTTHDKPKDFNAFLSELAAAGFEHKWGRGGALSFRAPAYGQTRFTRLRSSTLGEGYCLEDIQAVVEGRVSYSKWRQSSQAGQTTHKGRRPRASSTPRNAPRKFGLVIDIQEKMKQGKGPAYEKWATVYNLKMMAAALQYLQENNLLDYSDLAARADSAAERFHSIGDKLKQTEAAMKHNAELRAAVVDYTKTRPIFEEYKSKKYSNKYLEEHRADIAVYRAAQATMKTLLNGAKLPKMAALRTEWQTLAAAKKSGYAKYRAAQKDMREAVTIKANIDHLLGITDTQKNRDIER